MIDGKALTEEALNRLGAKSFRFVNGGAPTQHMPIETLKARLRESQKAVFDFSNINTSNARMQKASGGKPATPLRVFMDKIKSALEMTAIGDEGGDPRKFSVEEAKRVMEDLRKISTDEELEALLAANPKVTLGGAHEDLRVLDRMAQEADQPSATDDSGKPPDSTFNPLRDDPELAKISWGNISDESMRLIAIVNQMSKRVRRLTDELTQWLALMMIGASDLLAILAELDSVMQTLSASKTGIVSADHKRRIGEIVEKLRVKYFEYRNKARDLFAKAGESKDDTTRAKYQKEAQQFEEAAEKVSYVIKMTESMTQPLDGFVQGALEQASKSGELARSFRSLRQSEIYRS